MRQTAEDASFNPRASPDRWSSGGMGGAQGDPGSRPAGRPDRGARAVWADRAAPGPRWGPRCGAARGAP